MVVRRQAKAKRWMNSAELLRNDDDTSRKAMELLRAKWNHEVNTN